MTDTSDKSYEESILSPKPVDAKAKIIVSGDKMKAYIYVYPPENGGKEVSYSLILNELNKNKVNFGVIKGIASDIIKNQMYSKEILIAQGIEPVNGIDGSYKLLFSINKDVKPKEKEDGSVDYKDLDLIKNVEKSQPLCLIVLPVEGKNGTNVYGQPVMAKKGKPVPSLTGKNTVVSENGKIITASARGYVTFNNGKIYVNDTLNIKEDVGNSTGNIKTFSNIAISGTILRGFSVETDGNIKVEGTVSGAFIKAGGNVNLKNGIIGGKLECEGDLLAGFIENCDVFVKGSVKANYIMNSKIVCAKNIEVIGSKSKIVGGNIIAGGNITAHTIGTITYTKTNIEIGTDPDVIRRQQELYKMIPDLEEKVLSLQSLLGLFQQLLNAHRLTEDKQEAFYDAIYSYKTSFTQLQEFKQELNDIKETIKKRGYGKIMCLDTIYPGTVVKIGDFKMLIKTTDANKKYFYSDEGIVESFAI